MKKLRNSLRNKKFILIAILIVIVGFSVAFDYFNLDEKLYFVLTGKSYYDILFQENLNLGTVATLLAVLVALYSSWKSIDLVNNQLKIEQTPIVVVKNNIDVQGIEDGRQASQTDKYMLIRFKNIGRGPAKRVTCCLNHKKPDAPFFIKNESHSFDLGANEMSDDRKIDDGILRPRMIDKNGSLIKIDDRNPLKIHIYYEDQLKNKYHNVAKFFWEGGFLKLMENKTYKK